MSSFRKREKVAQREHRERGQIHSRRNLGLLEKHKDYVIRAKSFHKKKTALKSLHEKARNRNPDEFYYKMVNTSLKDGKHVEEQSSEDLTNDQLMLLKTRDHKYIQMKVTSERNKIERLTSSLHLTDQAARTNTHTYFVDSDNEEEVEGLIAKKNESRKSRDSAHLSDSSSGQISATPVGKYNELNQRLNRLKELRKMSQKMDTRKKLLTKERHYRIPGSCDGVPVTYKWIRERKK